MRYIITATILALAPLAAGCGGDDDSAAPAPTAPTTEAGAGAEAPATSAPEADEQPATSAAPETGPYDEFVRLVDELGGDVIDRDDAAIRASLVCGEDGGDFFGGVPISEFPTDLALVRAYCPEREAELS